MVALLIASSADRQYSILSKNNPMLTYILRCLLSVSCLSWSGYLVAQDVESIISSEPITFQGRVSAGASFSATNQDQSKFSPYSYRIIGSPSISIYGFDFPFTFAIYDSQFNFSKPTNRFGLNPKYKWVQLYFGQNSFSMSPYVMSGMPVDGYGVELTPGKFKFTVTTGTVQNLLPSSDTLLYAGFRLPTFERKLSAAKLGYSQGNFALEMSAVKAKDNQADEIIIPDSLKNSINPEENFAVGIKLDLGITKYVKFGINAGGSLITDDLAASDVELDPFLQDIADKILDPNRSTRASWAGDTYLRFSYKGFMLGGKIKRVEPDYRTLGLFNVADDYQNYTIDTRFMLFGRKLSLGGSFGLQQNNLRNSRSTTALRKIISVNASYFHSAAFNLTTAYSNFTQDQTAGLVEVNDSLRYGQVSQNLTISPRYTIKDGDNSHSISITYMAFSLEDMSQVSEMPLQSNNVTINTNYGYRIKRSGLSIKGGVNYGKFSTVLSNNSRVGVTLGLSKNVQKSLNASLSNNFNIRSQDGNSDGWMNALRLNLSYPISKKQNVTVGLNHSLRENLRQGTISTFRTNINYSLRL